MITICENMGRSQKVRLKTTIETIPAFGRITVRESEITASLDHRVANGYLTLVKEPKEEVVKVKKQKRGKTLNE